MELTLSLSGWAPDDTYPGWLGAASPPDGRHESNHAPSIFVQAPSNVVLWEATVVCHSCHEGLFVIFVSASSPTDHSDNLMFT